MAANRVDLDPWLPASAPKPAGAAPAAPVPAGPAASREWSRERIDFSALSALDADLTATAEAIVYGSYVVDGAELAAKLKDGVLDISKLRSEEHTSELQSLMRISYAVFCLKKKRTTQPNHNQQSYHQTNENT